MNVDNCETVEANATFLPAGDDTAQKIVEPAKKTRESTDIVDYYLNAPLVDKNGQEYYTFE